MLTRYRLAQSQALALAVCWAPLASAQSPADKTPASEPEKRQVGTDAAEPILLVEGQVTNKTGQGMAGAVVRVLSGADQRTIAESKSTRFGDFTIYADKPFSGEAIVVITADGHAEMSVPVMIMEGGRPPFIGETLVGDLSVTGKVTNAANGNPIKGAKVAVTAEYDDRESITDEAGRFKIGGFSPGPTRLAVEAEGFGREQVSIEEVSTADATSVQLKPERIVQLVVLDDLGQPVKSAGVDAYDRANDDFRTTLTDSGGSATIRGLSWDTESLAVRLSHENHVASDEYRYAVELPGDTRESTHKLVFARAGRLRGTVRDLVTNRPIAGSRVVTGDRTTTDSPRDWTNHKGEFEIIGVPTGACIVTVHATQYAPTLESVHIDAGTSSELAIKLGPAAVIEGVVLSLDGKPVGSARIESESWRDFNTLDLRAISDEQGRFTIEDAPQDQFDLRVSAPSFETARASVHARDDQRVTIELSPRVPSDGIAPPVGSMPKPLSLTAIDGATYSLESLKGKTVLLEFWATWCAPCVAELPKLKALHKKYGHRKDFMMLGVSLDGDGQAFRRFVRDQKIAWPQVVGNGNGVEEATRAFGVEGIPASFIIDPTGKVGTGQLSAIGVRLELDRRFKKESTR